MRVPIGPNGLKINSIVKRDLFSQMISNGLAFELLLEVAMGRPCNTENRTVVIKNWQIETRKLEASTGWK